MASTSSPQTEETFPYPLGVNVADSFTLRLCATNYFAWKQLMLRFLESHGLSGFVDGAINPREEPPPLWESSIFLEEHWLREEETREEDRQEDWKQQHMQQKGETQSLEFWVLEQEGKQKRREGEWEEESLEEQERRKEWERRKKWGHECYLRRKQMQERMEEEQKEREDHSTYKRWKRPDVLVRGWILATVSEEILLQVTHLATAREVWIDLEKILTPRFQLSHLELIDWKDQERVQIASKYDVLYNAALTADWDTAAEFWGKELTGAVFQPITLCLETALIVAVRSANRNHFVKKVIMKMQQEGVALIEEQEPATQDIFGMEPKRGGLVMERERLVMERMRLALITQQDISGATALHAAVDGGNIEAAVWLVQKNSELANIGDKCRTLPVHVAAGLGNKEMVDFLLQRTTKLSETESGLKLLFCLASSGLYDIALTFLQQHRNLASIKPSPLVVLAEKPTSFLSGTNFNLLERLIYSVIPLKLEDIANHPPEWDIEDHTQEGPPQRDIENQDREIETQDRESENQARDIENSTQESDTETQERDNANDPPEPENPTQEREIENPCKCYECCCRCIVFALIHVRHKLCSVVRVHCFQKLTALFWNVAEKLVPPIESIRKTKLKHFKTLRFVKCFIKETEPQRATEIFKEVVRKATCMGINEIVDEICEPFPMLSHLRREKYRSLFHLAIEYRQENVFNLIYQMEENRDEILSMRDSLSNNALHLAGNLRPQQKILLQASVAGAALQMQRELQWFEEVGNFILTQAKEDMNADGKTPQELFTETHKDLVKKGEQWMKDTANSCTIVAALITTIVFAAAITVPGGSFSDSGFDKKGLPIRLGGRAFTVFGVSDALAMFCSSSSLLMFLSILTCRYAEEDFRYSLPRRLIIGLVTLFLSIISMMVAFGATLKIVFGEKTAWLLYPVAALSIAPIALFALWQFPLLHAMIKSTYFPGIFGKKSNRTLH